MTLQYGPPRRGGRRGKRKDRISFVSPTPPGFEKLVPPAAPKRKVAPKVEVRDPAKTKPKISVGSLTRLFGGTVGAAIAPAITATPTAEATPGPWIWQQNDFDIAPELEGLDVDPRYQRRPEIPLPDPKVSDFVRKPVTLPEVPWKEFKKGKIGITRSPKIGTVEIRLPLDYYVPAPIRIDPFPDAEIWKEPEVPIEILFPEPKPIIDVVPPQVETKPKTRAKRKAKTKTGQKTGTITLTETVLNIEIVAEPKMQPKIRLRNSRVKTSTRRKKDTKANRRWIKAAHKLINSTYGTWSEFQDLVDALVWNVYSVTDDELNIQYAMALEDGNATKVLQGLAEGKYELDTAGFIIDYVTMQAQDMIQGRASKAITKEVIDNGNWTSPMGPQGMLSRPTQGVQDVSQNFIPS